MLSLLLYAFVGPLLDQVLPQFAHHLHIGLFAVPVGASQIRGQM